MKQARGFTLIELAIVLVIITILIGGLAMPLSAQIQARRIGETNRTLEEAREAIIGFAMSHTTSSCTCKYKVDNAVTPSSTVLDPDSSNPSACPVSLCPASPDLVTTTDTATLTLKPRHYLPCPDKLDDGDPATTDDGDGVEDRVGADCAQSVGYLPWVTLGTAAQDAWGNRIHYSLTKDPDDPLDPNDPHGMYGNKSTGFSNSDRGDNVICSSSSGGCSGIVAKEVPVVILSHGPNGWGALNVNGNTLKNPTSDDEKENTNTDTEFVSRTPYKPADGSAAEQAKEFDDLVVWISDGLLKSRVCPSGGCP